jgi:Fe-S-cluster containining protein
MTSDTIIASDLFECQNCGDCCKGYGGTFVSPDDIKVIAGFIGEDTKDFLKRYCQMSGDRPVLIQGDNGYCTFWDDQCTIHRVKPRMCRAWPFIEGVLADIANWHIMAQFCPGIRTDMPDDMILKYVSTVVAKGNLVDMNL